METDEILLDQKRGDELVDRSKRFVVNFEQNMVVPFRRALKLLQIMNLPVYSDYPGEYKCHFSDVCKRLTRFAMNSKI